MDERLKVARSMIKYGGSFVTALGKALIHADILNTRRIKRAFPEYWQQYLKLAEAKDDSNSSEE